MKLYNLNIYKLFFILGLLNSIICFNPEEFINTLYDKHLFNNAEDIKEGNMSKSNIILPSDILTLFEDEIMGNYKNYFSIMQKTLSLISYYNQENTKEEIKKIIHNEDYEFEFKSKLHAIYKFLYNYCEGDIRHYKSSKILQAAKDKKGINILFDHCDQFEKYFVKPEADNKYKFFNNEGDEERYHKKFFNALKCNIIIYHFRC